MSEMQLGAIALFGSGETSPAGRKVFDALLRSLRPSPRVALLETPAGFELNSAQVVGRIEEFIRLRLQNYHPQTVVIPARRKEGANSTDDAALLKPLEAADLIFLGPGSPTYAVRQLCSSLAWNMLLTRHRLGASLVFASAAVIAASTYALPVYEIYKVGEDLHWKPGLDLLAPFGLKLVLIPHWNNQDGGEELDTHRCFLGQERFARMMQLLPGGVTVIGIEEKTALIMDLEGETCRVMGQGGVSLMHTEHQHKSLPGLPVSEVDFAEIASERSGHVHRYEAGQSFSIRELGPYHRPKPGEGISAQVWETMNRVESVSTTEPAVEEASQAVLDLMAAREGARRDKNWAAADEYRRSLAALGWHITDTPDGPQLKKLAS